VFNSPVEGSWNRRSSNKYL